MLGTRWNQCDSKAYLCALTRLPSVLPLLLPLCYWHGKKGIKYLIFCLLDTCRLSKTIYQYSFVIWKPFSKETRMTSRLCLCTCARGTCDSVSPKHVSMVVVVAVSAASVTAFVGVVASILSCFPVLVFVEVSLSWQKWIASFVEIAPC